MKRFQKTKCVLEALAWASLVYVIGHAFVSFVNQEIYIPFTFETESSRIAVLHSLIFGSGVTMIRSVESETP